MKKSVISITIDVECEDDKVLDVLKKILETAKESEHGSKKKKDGIAV